jgi:putative transposase
MYLWRSLNHKQRQELLAQRKRNQLPWHSPPHRNSDRSSSYMFTAACYEHRSHIGLNPERMRDFENQFLNLLNGQCDHLIAWVVLPNHYHFLADVQNAISITKHPGKLHGRTACAWNQEEGTSGRKVWFGVTETVMKSDRHFWATLNYIHHNPVKHGYVERWQDWPFSSAQVYLESMGKDEAAHIWRTYPITNYGKGWDD